nr:MAG TPA: hypothetical protein [Caudoviricetes sp.]
MALGMLGDNLQTYIQNKRFDMTIEAMHEAIKPYLTDAQATRLERLKMASRLKYETEVFKLHEELTDVF